jgi:hypothetical protein
VRFEFGELIAPFVLDLLSLSANSYSDARSVVNCKGSSRIRACFLHFVLCFALLLTASAAGLAQSSTAGWQVVETIKSGTSIRITLTKEKFFCSFDSADENGLVCHKRRAGVDHSISLQRDEILLIRARNATGSIIGGTLIGAGLGAGIGATVDAGIKNPETTNNAKFTGGLARAGGLLGALMGLATEFVPGKLLYKSEIQHR